MTVPVDLQGYDPTKQQLSEEERFFDWLKKKDYVRYKEMTYLKSISEKLGILASYRVLAKGMVTRTVTVGTSATKLVQSTTDRSYTIINPTAAIGLTTPITYYAAGSTFSGLGNTQADPISISNYDSMHLMIDVTAVSAGTFNFIAQIKDPLSGNWVDTQDIQPAGITGSGTIYAYFSGYGLSQNFALRWTDNGGGGILTGSIGYTLKVGLGGAATGDSNTIYIGNQNVTRFTGYPLLEGQFRDWFLRENSEMYAVSVTGSVDVNVIEYI